MRTKLIAFLLLCLVPTLAIAQPRQVQDFPALPASANPVDGDVDFLIAHETGPGVFVTKRITLEEARKRADVTTVANVAALYALTAARDNQHYLTLGYTNEGVGVNLYRYDAASAAVVDYLFVLDGVGGNGTGTGTGRFIATDQTRADVTKAGVIPDDATNDATEFQRAVTAGSAKGVPIYVPGGTVVLNSTITPPAGTSKFHLYGAGRASTILDFSGLTNVAGLDISNTLFSHIHDLKIVGDSSSGHAIMGVDPTWESGAYLPQHTTIERVWITGFTGQQVMSGVITGGTTPANDVTIQACGVFIAGGLEVHVLDSPLSSNDIGCYLFKAGQPKVGRCVFDSNAVAGIVSQDCEGPAYFQNDVLASSTTVGATFQLVINSPRRNASTIDSAGLLSIGDHGCVITENKFKGSRTNIVTESEWSPVISRNWIRADVKTGVLNYGPARITDNTFYPAYIAPKTFTTNFAVNDKLTSTAHGFVDGEEIVLYSSNLIPAGLFANTPLFVKNATANDFELATTPGGVTLDITSDGTGTHSVAVCRRDVWYDLPNNTTCNIGAVSQNTFGFGGGGVHHSNIHASTPNNSYPIDGTIEGNYFGQPGATANATRINFPVCTTNAVRGLTIRNNVHYIPTNVHVVARYFLTTNATLPGPLLAGNVTQNLGGTLQLVDQLPPNDLFRTEQDIVVNVADFGAIANDSTDDHTAFINAIAAIPAAGGTLFIPPGTYDLNPVGGEGGLEFSSIAKFKVIGFGATLRAANTMPVESGNHIILVNNCADFSFHGLTIDGNRANRTPTEIWAHGIAVHDCDRFSFANCRVINSTCDNWYIGPNNNNDAATYNYYGRFENCSADNGYRQGMSIIGGFNLQVVGGSYTNTTGTAPQAGIDIEADVSNIGGLPVAKNIVVRDAYFAGNVGVGIQVSGQLMEGILIEGNEITDCDSGAIMMGASGTIRDNYIHDFTAVSNNGVVDLFSSSYNDGVVIAANQFKTISAAKPCVYTHGTGAHGASIVNNRASGVYALAVIVGDRNVVNDNDVSIDSALASPYCIGVGTGGDDCRIISNTFQGFEGRAIYTDGERTQVIGNNFLNFYIGDVAGIAAVDVDANGDASVRDNIFWNSGATPVYAIRTTTGSFAHVSGSQVTNYNADWSLPNGGTITLEHVGTGAPSLSANIGSRFWRTDGGSATTGYLKESGAGTAGWVAIAPGGGGVSDGDKGDILISGSGTVYRIDDDPVTLTVDSATPSVTDIRFGQTANTVSTNYTNFTGGVTGQELEIHVNDANTAFTNNANLSLIGGVNIPASSDPYIVKFRKDATQWKQISYASAGHQFSTTADGSDNLTLSNSTTDSDIDVNVVGTSGVIRFDVAGTDRLTIDNDSVDVTGILGINTAVIRTGTGSPEGAVTGNNGDIFLRTDGGAGTSAYLKEDDGDNTTWTAFAFGGGSGLPSGGSVGDLVVNTAPGAGAWSSVLSVGANGTTITGGTVTASTPVIAATQTWGSGAVVFDGIDLNVTNSGSATGSRLLNLRIGGISQFQVTSTGAVRGVNGIASAPTYSFTGDTDTGMYYATNQVNFAVSGTTPFIINANGASITGGTVVNPATPLAITQTWNDAADTFLGITLDVTNTASAAASRLFRIRGSNTGTSERFYVNDAGYCYSLVSFQAGGGQGNSNPGFQFEDASNGFYLSGSQVHTKVGGSTMLSIGTVTSYSAAGLLYPRSVEANTAGSGAPNVLASTESHRVLTNEGATAANYHTLPTAAAGLTFTFIVHDTDGLRVTAASGDTIRLGNKVTATAGYVESTTIGDTITLVAINATEWVAVSTLGTWTDGTFTFTLVSST